MNQTNSAQKIMMPAWTAAWPQRLLLALWLLVATAFLAIFAADLFLSYEMIATPCAGQNCHYQAITEAEAAVLAAWGLPVAVYALYILGISVLPVIFFTVLAVVMLTRLYPKWGGFLYSLMLILVPVVVITSFDVIAAAFPQLNIPLQLLVAVGQLLVMSFFMVFPRSRFEPRWTFLIPIMAAIIVVTDFFYDRLLSAGFPLVQPFALLIIVVFAVLVYRYKWLFNHAERQQTKWVVWGMIIIFVGIPIWTYTFEIAAPAPGQARLLTTLGGWTLCMITTMALPAAIFIAILRDRLWDIDLIINRTLVYGGLTAGVTAVYLLMIGGLGLLAVGQQWRLLGVVLATAFTAILLKPVKITLQTHVNRLIPLPPKADPTPTESVSHAPVPHERWLPWAQTAVACHILLSLVMFGAGTAVFYAILTTPCTTDCAYFLQLQPAEVTALSSLGLTLKWYALFQISLEFLYLITFSLTGGVIYAKLVRPRGPQVWYGLLASLALISVGTILLAETSLSAASIDSGWQLLYELLKASGYVAFLTFCLFFPDGRIIPHWVRWPVFATLLWMTAWVLLPLPTLDPANTIGIYPSLAMLALIVGVQIYRYRRISGPLQRQQTKWLVFGFGIVFTAVFIWTIISVALPFPPGPERLLSNLIGQGILALFPVTFAACIAISLLRYRLWDIDILINRTLVYGGLTLSIVVIYTLVVGGLSAILHTRGNFGIALLATGFIAVLFQPLRERLQRGVNRFMFGERDDPYKVLSQLGRQLGETAVPGQTLPAITTTICQTLKLPYAAIQLTTADGGRQTVAVSGQPATGSEEWPLLHQGEVVGWLIVAPRAAQEQFTSRECQLLTDIAGQTGAAAYAVRLTAALQHSREKLVLAREEERRRIRRDLHDELGPTLASQTFAIDAVLDLLESNPQEAARLLRGLKAQNQETVTEIRRLVYELRPPTLDELGLVGALQAHMAQLNGRSAPAIHLTATPDPLPPLSAAVEVAAYRIALEAMTNVVRHAQARRCDLLLHMVGDHSPHLHMAISDDGVGLPPTLHSGVGIRSMRERAEELGGALVLENGVKGVRLTAVLPLSPQRKAENR